VWPQNSPDLKKVDYSMWRLLQEKVYEHHQRCKQTERATGHEMGQAGSRRHCDSHLSAA